MSMNDGQDSMDWTPEMALDAGLEQTKKEQPSAAMVILLWNEGGSYDTSYYNSGMKTSEMLALLEVAKSRILRLMDGEDAG